MSTEKNNQEIQRLQRVMNAPPKSNLDISQIRLQTSKPCPFCGSDWILKGERYFAICNNCGATGPEKGKCSESKLILSWDTRI